MNDNFYIAYKNNKPIYIHYVEDKTGISRVIYSDGHSIIFEKGLPIRWKL